MVCLNSAIAVNMASEYWYGRPTFLRRTKYVYSRQGTRDIFYNKSKNGIVFIPIGYDNVTMGKYYDVFVGKPLTAEERAWLKRYDYALVGA